ncbi:IclR family transcriptional regulator [Geobacter hydrogenophilus]|uniref:IclR family transcriptional regulator n=1 Tax=Geobacter hydrogenophilus TaxID=40983 RepID=A0A9W6G2F9_9BACT|nr:IclR family transcriptional regulator [Geobacter hydrogenophilus]MBT0895600.1 IclR family transcriptional regulator [Geobacter hydrogenophilus]GLI39291.1 IclR family transcriptional regulator [Geobacter hydrogenophilus]
MKTKSKAVPVIKSVDHAFELLEQFRGDVNELSLSELGRRLQLPKNNVFRLLATLESRRFIEHNSTTGSYRLGLKAFHLSRMVSRQMRLVSRARPTLEAMVRESNETVCLTVLRDFSIVCLDAVECSQPVRVVPPIGMRLPAYCTAAGKIQLAHLPEDKVARFLAEHKLERNTPSTITDPASFLEHLQPLKEQGYAVSREELEVGVTCVAAPVHDYSSNVIGAVVLPGPITRFSEERINEVLIPLAKKGAEEISSQLGYF